MSIAIIERIVIVEAQQLISKSLLTRRGGTADQGLFGWIPLKE